MKEVLPGWLMVEVEKDAYGFITSQVHLLYFRPDRFFGERSLPKLEVVDLGFGRYEIVGIVTEVSEEGMADVARSNGFEPERTLLIKKLNHE